jgi:thiamine pyrophosphate-dependent acetolactate synthase large subunit-like protein
MAELERALSALERRDRPVLIDVKLDPDVVTRPS